MSYTSAAWNALLALYGDKAEDVSPLQASYRYIQLAGDTTVHHGYMLVEVTAEALKRAEDATRLYYRAGVYLWRDGKWFELPSSQNNQYSEATARSGCPNFAPTGFRPVSPSSGTKTESDNGIYAERSQRTPEDKIWWWITGSTYPQRELLKRAGCRWSKGRKAWYFTGATLPPVVAALATMRASPSPQPTQPANDDDAPCSDEEAERILGVSLSPKSVSPVTSIDSNTAALPTISSHADSVAIQTPTLEPPQPEPIRIIKPVPLPESDSPLDNVQSAIRDVQRQPASPIITLNCSTGRTISPVQQAYCGELTGSITGQVFCYGFAVYRDVLLYLNLGGPRMAVEAIRARLSKGEIVNLVPPDAPALQLSPGETDGKANTGMYTAYLQNLPEARFTSAILVHEWLTAPNYNGKAITGIIRTGKAQAAAKLLHHVRQLVNIPVFEEWSSYLYRAGQSAGLVREPHPAGIIDLLIVELDVDGWTRLLTGGLANAVIVLP